MKLVDDWKQSWKWHSVWIAGIIAALPAAWGAMPSDLKAQVPSDWMPYVSMVMFAAFFIGRIRKQ